MMILVLILLIILILLLFLAFLMVISTLKVEVQDLFLSNLENSSKRQIGKVIFSLSIGKFNWLKISLNQKRIKLLYTKMHLERIDIKKIEQDFKWENLKVLPKLHLMITYFHLRANLGFKSPITTAFTIASIASLISILLSHFAKEWKKENYQYSINPIYLQKNLYQINFNCIIEFKMVHIINVIYIFVKKGKSDKNEPTTSNRKSYGYSYE